MAFGSGSSFATDRWMRRGGLPSSAQASSVGRATWLHQHSSKKPTAHSGSAPATSISRSRRLLFFRTRGRGGYPPLRPHPANHEQARKRRPHRLPEMRSSVSPSSKAASEAIARVHRLLWYPNSLGERWSISRSSWALFRSKASRVLFGREDFAWRARRPLPLKSWMASRTVCEAHPRFKAIFGARSPLELARSICDRRMVKVSLERRPLWRLSRSSSDNGRTKIGVFMGVTVTRHPKPILKTH